MRRHAILLTWLLAGCAPMAAHQQPALETSADAEVAVAMLSYFDRLNQLPAAELGKEFDQAQQAFAKRADDANRLRLALLLSLPQHAYHDDARALELLEPLRKRGGSLGNLAALLNARIAECKRLEGNLQTLNAKIKDEQKRGDTLQQKLDALRNLERNLIERESTKRK